MENKYLEKIAISEAYIKRRIENTTDTDRLKRFSNRQRIRANLHGAKVNDIHEHVMNSGLPMDAHIDDIKKAVNFGDREEKYKRNARMAYSQSQHIRNTRQLPVPVQRPNMAGKAFLKLKANPKLVAGAVGAAAVAGIGKHYYNKSKTPDYRYGY